MARSQIPTTIVVKRSCCHCGHVFEEDLTNEEIRKTIFMEPISICPNPACQLPT